MNLRGGWALVRRSLFSFMAGRAFFWTLALGWMMGPLVYLFVWSTAAGQGAIGGFGRDEFIFYYLGLILVNQLTYPCSNWTVGDVIRSGGFSTWLLRPLPPVYEAVASDLALKVVTVPFALAVVLLLGLVLRPSVSWSSAGLPSFVAALLLAQVVRFLWAYVLALLALWYERSDALLQLNDTLIFLLAGQVAPIALLPGPLQSLAEWLPYRYMIGFPIELLLGRLTAHEVWMGLGVQMGWLVLGLLAYRAVWRRGLRHYVAVGG